MTRSILTRRLKQFTLTRLILATEVKGRAWFLVALGLSLPKSPNLMQTQSATLLLQVDSV